jgi:glycosyltransferase 2 family protein
LKYRKLLKLSLKIAISGFALYVVFSKIEGRVFCDLLVNLHPGWLFVALVFFNLSKVLSAFRLNTYFQMAGTHISPKENLRLYYVGMFYNLFLPGGIGGDGFKVYLLNKAQNGSVKKLVSASLLDRLSGLTALVALASGISVMLISSYFKGYQVIPYFLGAGVILVFPAYYLLLRLFFKDFTCHFFKTNLQSLGVQLLQIGCAFFILVALGVDARYVEYFALFLVSSIVAVLPFTIGGIGAREMVFLFAGMYLGIEEHQAVTFSILFFLITALSSFVGIFLDHKVTSPVLAKDTLSA